MRRNLSLLLPVLILLAGCGPEMEAHRAMAGRMVTIRNTDSASFRIERIIANEARNSESCIDRPNRVLAPGESYDVTFIVCGAVVSLEVQTDRGTSHLRW